MTIPFEQHLNSSQWKAVSTFHGPVLVIAGAGSGKTRTIVYRLVHMMEQGIQPESILLLTFTRKASREMLHRASMLINKEVGAVQGGTFHSFAHLILRKYIQPPYTSDFTILDRPDCISILKEIKSTHKLGKGDRSFPKSQTVLELLGKARNKELSLNDVLSNEASHLLRFFNEFETFHKEYAQFKKGNNLVDFDDLLFLFEKLLQNPEMLAFLRDRYRYIMVDEYQDTNLVQARIVRALAGNEGNIMAVGDDAQSIYAFRGANVENILSFSDEFASTKIIKLEQNYRSTQQILDLANSILSRSTAHYQKQLYSEHQDGALPEVFRPDSDKSQAADVVSLIQSLMQKYPPYEIAVLFRAGYQSYHIEMILNRAGIRFVKFGGLQYTEAAHIKDILSFLRFARNASDYPSWMRIVSKIKGIGPKTAKTLFTAYSQGDMKALNAAKKKYPELNDIFKLIDSQRLLSGTPTEILERIYCYYLPLLMHYYPDDYPRREAGLEEFRQIALAYTDIDLFLADLSLENPETAHDAASLDQSVCLSTIHSSKGLEWSAVILVDLVQDRFPNRKAQNSHDDYEEERRLMYVACTRAKEYLALFSPKNVFVRGSDHSELARTSSFLLELDSGVYNEHKPNISTLKSVRSEAHSTSFGKKSASDAVPVKNLFCKHKIFGRGKVIQKIPPNKYRINFPGFGTKVIIADYLDFE